ncbi:MAG: hypothetical protein AAFR82_04305 [Pseudomonadota bacterium]
MHGTNEAQKFVGEVLCDLIANETPVRIGFEAARTQSAALNALTEATFSDQQAYEAARQMWDSPDGRSSQAALSLLRRISDWRTSGAEIEVFAFDFAPSAFPSDLERGRHASMAAMVDEAATGFEGAILLVAGNYHTPIVRRTMEPVSGSMSNMITARPVVSLEMAHNGGGAFVTYSMNGGELTTGELTLSKNHAIDIEDWSVRIEPFGVHYRGTYSVGSITASPPAFATEH